MRIHEGRIHLSTDTLTTSCTSVMPSPPLTPSLCAPTINITMSATDTDTTDFSCPYCPRTFTSRIGLVGHLKIHRIEADEPVPEAPTYTCRIRRTTSHHPSPASHRTSTIPTATIQLQPPTHVGSERLGSVSVHVWLEPDIIPTRQAAWIGRLLNDAPKCHLQRKWEVCISTRSPCGFGCTDDLSLRLSRNVKRRG
ncbi:hypothetical protein SprV_0602246500 [Sparganum proliferum]